MPGVLNSLTLLSHLLIWSYPREHSYPIDWYDPISVNAPVPLTDIILIQWTLLSHVLIWSYPSERSYPIDWYDPIPVNSLSPFTDMILSQWLIRSYPSDEYALILLIDNILS